MGSSRRVVVRLSHAQARELMYAAAIVTVDARVYQLGVRQVEVLLRGRAAIQAGLDAQATRREAREAKAAEDARRELEEADVHVPGDPWPGPNGGYEL